MGIFNKITNFIDLQHNNTKQKVVEYLFPPEKEQEIQKLIKDTSKISFPLPNNDVEFIVPQFNARKYYTHLKKTMWKHYRR